MVNEDISEKYSRRGFLARSVTAGLSSLLLAASCSTALPPPFRNIPSNPENNIATENAVRQFHEAANPEKLIGQKAPAMYQHNINTSNVSDYIGPQDYKGKIVLLNFWASWCGPCRSELPEFATFQDAHPDDVVIIAAECSAKSDWHDVDLSKLHFPILEKKGKAPFTFSVCEKGSCTLYQEGHTYDDLGPVLVQYLYGLPGPGGSIPTTFIIDRNQVVRDFVIGGMKRDNLENLLKKYQ